MRGDLPGFGSQVVESTLRAASWACTRKGSIHALMEHACEQRKEGTLKHDAENWQVCAKCMAANPCHPAHIWCSWHPRVQHSRGLVMRRTSILYTSWCATSVEMSYCSKELFRFFRGWARGGHGVGCTQLLWSFNFHFVLGCSQLIMWYFQVNREGLSHTCT